LRQDALQSIFSGRLDIFYPPNFGCLGRKGSFSTPTRVYTHHASKTRRQRASVQFEGIMVMLFKLVCQAVLLACYRVVVRTYSVLRIPMPMDSFFRPHNLRKFRPDCVAPQTSVIARPR
jgi:hypothetical protein